MRRVSSGGDGFMAEGYHERTPLRTANGAKIRRRV